MLKAPADIIFHHPCIRPFAYDSFSVKALAVRAGRVIALGSREDINTARGPATRNVDLPGTVVQPGFHDAHIHLFHLHAHGGVALEAATTVNDVINALRRAADQTTIDQRPLLGLGCPAELAALVFEDHVDAIDEVSSGRLIVLQTRDGHTIWMAPNTAAHYADLLDEIAGRCSRCVHRALGATADGPGATGAVRLTDTAVSLLFAALPRDFPRPKTTDLEHQMAEILAAGVTCAHEALTEIADIDTLHDFFAHRPVERSGRIHAMLHAVPGNWQHDFAGLVPQSALHDARLSLNSIKAFLDGSLGSKTAWMTREQHFPAMDPRECAELAAWCADHGFQLALHAIGAQAVAQAVEIFEGARPPALSPYISGRPPWRIEHAEFADPPTIQRAAHAGVVISVQPLHIELDAKLLAERYAERLPTAFPWTDFTDGGVVMALGSDAPVVPVAPLANLAAGCGSARRDLLGATGAPLVLHALSREVALHAHTVGGALAAKGALGNGSLLVGEPADLIAIDGDPLLAPTEDLTKMSVLQTWVSGVRSGT